MIFPSRRRTVWAMVLLLAALVAVVSPAVALAQAPPGTPAPGAPPGQRAEPPPTRPATRDDFGNWGLLGLLGLVGLAGLLRRDRRDLVVHSRLFSPPFPPRELWKGCVSVTNGRLHSARASTNF